MLRHLRSALRDSPRLSRWSDSFARWPVLGGVWRKARQNPKEFERFAKFAIVGTLGAIVDFSTFNLMKWVFESVGLGVGWDVGYEARQIQLTAANTISFSLAVLSNFTWNRLWTFPESRERSAGRQLVQFAVVNIIGLGINTILLLGLDHYVFQKLVSDRLSYNLAKAVAIGVVLFWNFGVNRIWTYRGIR